MAASTRSSMHSVFRLLAAVSFGLSALVVLTGLGNQSLAVPGTVVRLSGDVFVVVGLILSVVSLVLIRFPMPISLSLVLLELTLGGAFVVWGRPQQRGDVEFGVGSLSGRNQLAQRSWHNAVDWTDIHIDRDPLLGIAGVPNLLARHFHRDFDTVYKLGPDGYRVMPPADERAPVLVFLGCSMTFGQGCANEQIFPWLLAEKAWPGYRVMDWSVSGWGTTHAAVNVENALRLDPKPVGIIYAMIGDHLKRNFRRKSWHVQSNSHFILFNEQGENLGVRPPSEANMEDTPELAAIETRITRSLLIKMKRQCDEAGVPLAILYMNETDTHGVGRMDQVLEPVRDIVVDVRDEFSETYPNDYHLTPMGHARLARGIARNQQLAHVVGRPDLYQPSVFPDRFDGEWDFRPRFNPDTDPTHHRVVHWEATEESLDVRTIDSQGSTRPDEMKFGRLLPTVTAESIVALRFRANSESLRSIRLIFDDWIAQTRESSGPYTFVADGEEKQLLFRYAKPFKYPRVNIAFGGDDSSFSITDFQVDVLDAIPAGWDWVEMFGDQTLASISHHHNEASGRVARIEPKVLSAAEGWKVQYHMSAMPVRKGGRYRLSVWCRSDRPKQISATIYNLGRPAESISNFVPISLGPAGAKENLEFEVSADEPAGIVTFFLGEDLTPTEFSDIQLTPIADPTPTP